MSLQCAGGCYGYTLTWQVVAMATHSPGKLVDGEGGVSKQESRHWPMQELKAATSKPRCTLRVAVTWSQYKSATSHMIGVVLTSF